MKYKVVISEVWARTMEIEADNPSDAVDLALNDDTEEGCMQEEISFEYSHTDRARAFDADDEYCENELINDYVEDVVDEDIDPDTELYL